MLDGGCHLVGHEDALPLAVLEGKARDLQLAALDDQGGPGGDALAKISLDDGCREGEGKKKLVSCNKSLRLLLPAVVLFSVPTLALALFEELSLDCAIAVDNKVYLCFEAAHKDNLLAQEVKMKLLDCVLGASLPLGFGAAERHLLAD